MPANLIAWPARLIAVTILAAIIILPATATHSSAHLPVFDSGGGSYETAERVEDLETSFAFYGELPPMAPGNPEGAKYYVFEGAEGQELKFEVGKKDFFFSPCVLLVGPGLPSPDEGTENIIESSALTLPEGLGALGWSFVFLPWADYLAESEFEPFTQTTFYYAYSESVLLPSEGTYYFILTGVVYSEDLGDYQVSSGKYFLVTGYEEKFTVLNFVLMPWYWSKTQSFWGEQGAILFMLPTAIVVGLLIALEALVRRKGEMSFDMSKTRKLMYFGGLTGAYLMIGGAVNQLLILAVYSPEHKWEGIVLLVLILQLGGLLLGVMAAGFAKGRFFSMRWPTLVVAAMIATLALVIGAGLIVGPIAFLGSLTMVLFADRDKPRGTR